MDMIHLGIGVVGTLALLLFVTNSAATVAIYSSDLLSEMVASSAPFIDRFTPVEGAPVVLDCENMGPTCSIVRSVGNGVCHVVEIMADLGNSSAEPQPPNPNANNESERTVTSPSVETGKKKNTSSILQENPNNREKRSTKQASHTGENFRLQ
ncbi:uncharacterized protein LOC111077398 [Drosophila obscura]|uniref:uncharacterized protein LOC111077398 n=1 Tax=Drosophila obscura TaxID=7282 RepID=UPI001BB2C34C|nr:uncharacterized protein LOC111077398 [Drosophila obscura]